MSAVLPILCLQGLLLAAIAPPTGAAPDDPASDAAVFASPTRLDHIGRILAPVMINGQGPFRLVVDTGASHSAISPQLASALGLVSADQTSMVVNGITGSAQLPSVAVARMQAGDLVVENSQLPVVWAPVMGGADGILGVAGLSRERILVDFKRDRVTISRSRGSGALAGFLKVFGKRLPGGLLAVRARIGGVPAQAIIDTGSERTLGNSSLRDALHAKRRPGQAAMVTSVYGATPEISDGEIEIAPPIDLGGVTITRVAVVYGDFHIFDVWDLNSKPALIIGMDVLGTVRALAIDFLRSELYLDTVLQDSEVARAARY